VYPRIKDSSRTQLEKFSIPLGALNFAPDMFLIKEPTRLELSLTNNGDNTESSSAGLKFCQDAGLHKHI
jgi:hypothetical protein